MYIFQMKDILVKDRLESAEELLNIADRCWVLLHERARAHLHDAPRYRNPYDRSDACPIEESFAMEAVIEFV